MSRPASCLICLRAIEPGQAGEAAVASMGYHAGCLLELFTTDTAPHIDVDRSGLPLEQWKMAGGVSISGMQPKLSMRLSSARAQLETVETGGEFILKPQSPKFAALPENEHLTMRLSQLAGIEIPPCGLVRLRDGSLAYIVRRYDRQLGSHSKLRQEDFCQLAGLPSDRKEEGSGELCVRLLRQYVRTDLEVELEKLYQRLAFAYLVGNGDLHLKNLSLVIGRDARPRLSPAYDQVCTRLVIPRDQLTLPICGKNDKLTRDTFLRFAEYAKLAPIRAETILTSLCKMVPTALDMISDSYLPVEMKEHYSLLISQRAKALS